MSPADKVVQSIFSVADKRPMLDFNYESDAEECAKKIGGAEIYDNKLQVVLPTPHGLELVCGSKNGETAFGE